MSHTHLPQPHHKTAESQRSDHAIITNHRQINHRSHPDHGPNRRMRAGIRSSPCTHPPPSAPTAATYLQTAEYQGSVNTPEANRQDISSTTTRARGPNRKSHHEIGTSPQPHPPTLNRRHSLPQPRNRGPPSNPSGNRTASPLYCATIHTTQVQRHSSGKAQ